MARRSSDREYQPSLLQCAAVISVVLDIPSEHPLLVLKKKLNWPGIREIILRHLRSSGCNVDGTGGRPLDVDLYVPLLVLQIVKGLDSRQMEAYLSENGVGRIFVDKEQDAGFQVRDHSNIARIMNALGAEGIKEINALVIREAAALGFADPTVVSGDTTAQELPIGYPNEPGILMGLAQRIGRSLEKLAGRGKRISRDAKKRAEKIILKAKEHHLFAKTKEKKEAILRSMVYATRRLLRDVEGLSTRIADDGDHVVRSTAQRLQDLVRTGRLLLPQILHWVKTGTVAKGKILHTGLTEARAIVRNKAGKKVEFGLQYLIGIVGGGYAFAELIENRTGESKVRRRRTEKPIWKTRR